MLGDNLDNSIDSRVLSAVGYVPFENIIGRVQRSSTLRSKRGADGEPSTYRKERAGMVVR